MLKRAAFTLTKPLRVEIATEARFVLYSKYLWVGLALGLIAGVVTALGLNSAALSAYGVFEESLADAAGQGFTLEEALSEPLNVTISESVTEIDNPLRYDFEYAANYLSLLQPWGYMANACKTLAMIFMPIIGFTAAAMLATKEFKHRTIRIRAIRSPLIAVESSLTLGGVLVCATSLAGCCLASLGCGLVTSVSVIRQFDVSVLASGIPDIGLGQFTTWALLSLALGAFFAFAGTAAGLVFRAAVFPVAVFTAYDLVMPMLSAWDVRSVWLTIADRFSAFEGSFHLGGLRNDWPIGVNIAVLLAWLLGFIFAGHGALRTRPRW